MAMSREGKAQLKAQLGEKLQKAGAVIVTEYRGLTVEQLTQLRNELRKADAEFKVTKNRILKRAINEDAENYSKLSEKLVGPIGAVYVYGDVAQATKSLLEFNKTNEKLIVKGGVFEGESLDESKLKAIADLPSKDVLMAQIVGSLISPHRGLLLTINGVTRNLVQVIAAIRDKKKD